MIRLNYYRVKNMEWMGVLVLCNECADATSLDVKQVYMGKKPKLAVACEICYRTARYEDQGEEEIFKYEKTEKG